MLQFRMVPYINGTKFQLPNCGFSVVVVGSDLLILALMSLRCAFLTGASSSFIVIVATTESVAVITVLANMLNSPCRTE